MVNSKLSSMHYFLKRYTFIILTNCIELEKKLSRNSENSVTDIGFTFALCY